MKPRGIPIAQIDTGTEADAKFVLLSRRLAPEAYYAAFGAYMSLVLRAWARAVREPDADHLGLIPREILDSLVGVRLLDRDGSIPAAVFDRYPGSVLDDRRKDADRKRVSSASHGFSEISDRWIGNPPEGPPDRGSNGVQRSPGDSGDPSSPLLSSGGRNTTGEGVQGESPGNGFDVAGWGFLNTLATEITGIAYVLRTPTGAMGERALGMLTRHGRMKVEKAWREVAQLHEGQPTLRQLLFEADDLLNPITQMPRQKRLTPEEESDQRNAARIEAGRKRQERQG